jgi:hypothetical protein
LTENHKHFNFITIIDVPEKVCLSLKAKRSTSRGEDAPLIISIPRPIVNAAIRTKAEKMQNYTDGERIYPERLAEPKL